MEEFVLSPPQAVLYLGGTVILVAALSVFLKQGKRVRKAIGIGVTVVTAGVIVFIFYRPMTITVDGEGIAFTRAADLRWGEVDSAVYEPNLPNSPFRPTVRTRGIAIGEFRTGRFLLSNGDRAQVFMEQSDSAVVLRTESLTYVLAPEDAAGLAEAVDTYRVYGNGGSR